MFNRFSKLLVFLVLGSSIHVHAMFWRDAIHDEVARATADALAIERDRAIAEQASREREQRENEQRYLLAEYEQERYGVSGWDSIEKLSCQNSRHPYALNRDDARLMLIKLRGFKNLPEGTRLRLVRQAQEEWERGSEDRERDRKDKERAEEQRQFFKRQQQYAQAQELGREQQRLANRNCCEACYEDFMLGCLCCWKKEKTLSCTAWQCIAGLLCCPTMGLLCTTTGDDCVECKFCNSPCCGVKVCWRMCCEDDPDCDCNCYENSYWQECCENPCCAS